MRTSQVIKQYFLGFDFPIDDNELGILIPALPKYPLEPNSIRPTQKDLFKFEVWSETNEQSDQRYFRELANQMV